MSATPRSPAPSASTSSPAHPTRSAPSANPLSPSSRSLPSPLPRYPPITLLSSDTSKIFAALYPVCLLIIYACCFSALVRHPNSLLLNTLCPVALLQCAYVVICLPPAGSRRAAADHATHATKESTSSVANPRLKAMKGLRKKGSHEDRAGNGKVATAILSLFLPLLASTPLLSALLILFGAPMTTDFLSTVLCAAHMSILAGTSLVYVRGTDASAWREIAAIACATDPVWGGALGTCFGAWLGAIPIPLDWDRPWQTYPITIITGAYIGHSIGCLLGRTRLLYGQRLQFDAEPEASPEEKKEADKKSD